jgi:hypothetical protein
MRIKTELVHLLPPGWDDHNAVFEKKPIFGLCGTQAEVLRGGSNELFLMALPIAMFADCERMYVTGVGDVGKVHRCPHCMAHPDYPLLLLGVA